MQYNSGTMIYFTDHGCNVTVRYDGGTVISILEYAGPSTDISLLYFVF